MYLLANAGSDSENGQNSSHTFVPAIGDTLELGKKDASAIMSQPGVEWLQTPTGHQCGHETNG